MIRSSGVLLQQDEAVDSVLPVLLARRRDADDPADSRVARLPRMPPGLQRDREYQSLSAARFGVTEPPYRAERGRVPRVVRQSEQPGGRIRDAGPPAASG